MSKTPVTPFKLYAYDTTGKFATPMLLSDLIESGITLDPTTHKMVVVPNGTEIVSFAEDDTNGIVLTYKDKAGVQQTLTAVVVTDNTLAYDTATRKLKSTVNGVASNDVDLSTLIVVSVQDSITGDGTAATPLKLVNDAAAPGNVKYYGTDATGVKGWFNLPGSMSISATAVASQVVEDIPLEGYGDPTQMLWAPNKWIALTNADGTPMVGSNGKNLVVPAYELP